MTDEETRVLMMARWSTRLAEGAEVMFGTGTPAPGEYQIVAAFSDNRANEVKVRNIQYHDYHMAEYQATTGSVTVTDYSKGKITIRIQESKDANPTDGADMLFDRIRNLR